MRRMMLLLIVVLLAATAWATSGIAAQLADPLAQEIQELRERVKELELRVTKLEMQRQILPPTDGAVPEGWRRNENGELWHYVVPLTPESNLKSE